MSTKVHTQEVQKEPKHAPSEEKKYKVVNYLLSELKNSEKERERYKKRNQKLERELIRREMDFQTVAENAPDVICRFNREYQHIYVNPAIEHATRMPAHLFIGKTPHEAGLPPEFADFWVTNIKKVLGTGEQFSMEFAFQTPIGERIFQCILVPETNILGQVETVLTISRDITSFKTQERMKNDFLGIVSHELKTPVTSLKAFAQLLEHKFTVDMDLTNAEHFRKMDSQLNRMTNLINDLLEVTRLEEGKMSFKTELFDFDALVTETVEEISQSAQANVITVKGNTKKDISGDKDRIGQVLTNLLTNAIKYSPSDPRIIIHLSKDKERVKCSVQDFGLGIPKEKQSQIFERFYRVGEENIPSPGLGLGLYIAKEIIKREGGEIWVESEEGKGSTFTFNLPIKK
jgi:PAS domain S-box-containing protein